ncbi:hypothetical protein [Streptomyces erythrochromogenes]|uniref:hypothetical protein n=1 Tax=Streptomyces erythrochromogenes TaxID=285574 RepID=UPI0036A9F198
MSSEAPVRPSTALARTSSVLTAWWAAAPLAFVAGDRSSGPTASVLAWVTLTGVVVAPVAGLIVAYAGGHRRVRRRFTVMSAVSLAVCLLLFLFWQFAMECPAGDPSCSP